MLLLPHFKGNIRSPAEKTVHGIFFVVHFSSNDPGKGLLTEVCLFVEVILWGIFEIMLQEQCLP